jgi:hypothetical protein
MVMYRLYKVKPASKTETGNERLVESDERAGKNP